MMSITQTNKAPTVIVKPGEIHCRMKIEGQSVLVDLGQPVAYFAMPVERAEKFFTQGLRLCQVIQGRDPQRNIVSPSGQ